VWPRFQISWSEKFKTSWVRLNHWRWRSAMAEGAGAGLMQQSGQDLASWKCFSNIDCARGGKSWLCCTFQAQCIFWHFCGNFRMSRGALQKLHRRGRYKKRTKLVFCTQSKKGSENRSSRFEPKISWISFSRGSGPPLSSVYLTGSHRIFPSQWPSSHIAMGPQRFKWSGPPPRTQNFL